MHATAATSAAIRPRPQPSASLGASAAWMSAGMAVYSAAQWAIIAILAKLGSVEMVGAYAMAVAIVTPVLMLAQLNLRALITTDVAGKHRFEDYRALRMLTLGAAFAAIALYSRSLIVILAAAAQAIEWHSDTYQSLMLRREQNDRVAASLILRSVLGLAALAAALVYTGSLPIGLAALLAARLAILFFHDSRGAAPAAPADRRQMLSILQTALPLGIVLVLGSLTTNVPRYFIGAALGNRELGIFSALASLATAGSLFVNAIGQVATPRLAVLFASASHRGFISLASRLTAVALLLGLAGVAVAALAGNWILAAAYTPAYAERQSLLVWVMAAAAAGYIASMLGYVITAGRQFRQQIPLQAAVLAATAAAAWLLVPAHGLNGAALAVAAGSAVQVLGEAWILRLALSAEASS